MTANLRTCPPKTRSFHRGLSYEFAGISARLATISCQSRNQAVIRLDSQRDVADTPGNTPAASLLELVPCHFSDVHKRRVSLCAYPAFYGIFRRNVCGDAAVPPLGVDLVTREPLDWLHPSLSETGSGA